MFGLASTTVHSLAGVVSRAPTDSITAARRVSEPRRAHESTTLGSTLVVGSAPRITTLGPATSNPRLRWTTMPEPPRSRRDAGTSTCTGSAGR
jgi:hypothetical protein